MYQVAPPIAGPAVMPAQFSNRAPYFSGDVDDSLEYFLQDYEGLADSCRLTDREKVEKILRYIPASMRNLWKTREGFATGNWPIFRRALQRIYTSVSTKSEYTKQKLYEFVRYSARSRMLEEKDVLLYYRRFLMLSDPLLDSRRLTIDDRDTSFWRGFHPEDQKVLFPRLIAKHPDQPADTAFEFTDVYDVACAAFTGNQIYPLEPQEQWADDYPRARGSSSDRTIERWFGPAARDPRQHDHHRLAPERAHEPLPFEYPQRDRRPLEPEPYHTTAPATETKTVRFREPAKEETMEDLIGRMHGMDIHDRAYAILFTQCADRFPIIMQTLPRPGLTRAAPPPANAFTYQTPSAPPPPTRQPWAHTSNYTPTTAPIPATSTPSPYLRTRPRIDGCAFCTQPTHRIRDCPGVKEYIDSGRALVKEDRLHLPDGGPIPNDGTGRGLRGSIDSWIARQYPPVANTPVQATYLREAPPPAALTLNPRNNSPSCLEEIIETNILQVFEVPNSNQEPGDESDDEPLDIFQVFAAEKKKREIRTTRVPELTEPTEGTIPTQPNNAIRPGPQYRYQASAADQHLVSELQGWLLDGKLTQTTPAHVLAASPAIRKEMVEKLRVRKVEANNYEETPGHDSVQSPATDNPPTLEVMSISTPREPAYSLPLQEINVLIGGRTLEAGVLDSGSQIVVIRQDLAREVGAYINPNRLLEMEGANGATNWTLGCAEYLKMKIGDVPVKIHAHVVEHAPFRLLLGRPFQSALLCRIEDLPDGKVEVSIRDPSDAARRIIVPSQPRKGRFASVRIFTYGPADNPNHYKNNTQPECDLSSSHSADAATTALTYKKVAKKVRPVPTSLPEDFRCIRRIPVDPLSSLPPLPFHPPTFTPGARLTQERLDALDLNHHSFLWPRELDLLHYILRTNELGLAWTEAEKGRFRDDYFSPVKIPVIEHIPWAHKNIPIPTGILDDVIQIFKDKFAAGVYEHSDASYRSRWFCVKKKTGALRLVHDLQPLNAVTIRNSGIPPFADQLIEAMAGRACYSMLDLFVGYDHRTLDIASRDLTTIQSPIGAMRLTCLPQGWTNAGAIFHEDVTFILEPEIPHVAWPYMDDCSIKGPATRSETKDGGFETIPNNPEIRKFIWQHLSDVHRILHRLCCAGATVSAKKLFIAVPEIIILGHKCNYEGRIPDDSKIARIRDWPPCKNITDVRAFLGTTGFMRIWIKNYSAIARPLVNLTRKGETFVWQQQHEEAMQALKDAIISSPALVSIDYTSDRPVYLAVDSSTRGVGWILSQESDDGRRRPARFGSISWNERESRYSQAKIELYGLFRALRALRFHLVGLHHLIVEMDAQYIRGMLNNPDIQPNATINRWIAAIHLFDFKLVHIPADKHQGPDGLSRRTPAEGEDNDGNDDPEEWIDHALSLGIWIETRLAKQQTGLGITLVWTLASDNSPTTNDQGHQITPSKAAFSDEERLLGDSAKNAFHSNSSKSAIFPADDKTANMDYELDRIRQYLASQQPPLDLSGSTLTRFINKTRRFLLLGGRLWRWQRQGRHQLYIDPPLRFPIVSDAHDKMGHKGFYSTRRMLLDRFWWPALENNVKWYIDTCHQCQIRQNTKIRIPPIVDTPAPLFRKVYIDTMFMPPAGGYRYIVQARCSLTAWPEWRALRTETGRTLGAFIFEDILCRWGAVEEIVTDNGTPYVAALDWLAGKYGICHIRISAYNSRANGIVERQHRTIRESIVKACEDHINKWPTIVPLAFWADRATTRKSTGFSPFYMAHGIEPILPFDITLATFLVPDLTKPLSTADLIAARTRQLEQRPEDLERIHDRIIKSRFASVRQFERQHEKAIQDFNFKPGALVLVRNSTIDSDLGRKTKPRYCGPMVVIRRTRNGAYRLAELDGAVSKLRYAAFRLVPYFSRSQTSIPVTRLLDREDLVAVIEDDNAADVNDSNDDELTEDGQDFDPPGDVRRGLPLGSKRALRSARDP
jgi:hypothetical protein